MSTHTRPRAGQPGPAASGEEKVRLEERPDLQQAVIEMLHVQVREQRARIELQATKIVELHRLLRVRDDLLSVRPTPAPVTVKASFFAFCKILARKVLGSD